MTFTYDIHGLSSELDRIRLEIGDTDSNRPLLQDEEIKQIISEFSGFNLRVSKCCRLICSRFSSEPTSVRIEGFAESYKDTYAHFKGLAEHYESLGGSKGVPWAGSCSADFKEATELDTTLVQPFFKRGMHNNNG